MGRSRIATLLVAILIAPMLVGSIAPAPEQGAENRELSASALPEEMNPKPDAANVYDNTGSMAGFGYRQIDTQANQNGRDWIASQLEGWGYEVERQDFQTNECSNCQNIVATLPGVKSDTWIVVGSHHDAICYSPPPIAGITYPSCSSNGAYDDGTGVGATLELARVMMQWGYTPEHTWKFGFWDYEEWQGSSASEGGGMGSLHFVETVPEGVDVYTYINFDMFGLNWPIQQPSLKPGCSEDFFTLYSFTSPIDDWSYYEDRGLEVTEHMREDAIRLQGELNTVFHDELDYPREWVTVIDDTKGNSDHFNFIQAGYAATWMRGMHQYAHEEGDTCEQTIKHSQTDTMSVLRTYAGGRDSLESGFQTVIDAVALMGWWDMNASHGLGPSDLNAMGEDGGKILSSWFIWLLPLFIIGIAIFWGSRIEEPYDLRTADSGSGSGSADLHSGELMEAELLEG